jgi:hypothetical protein
MNDELTIEHDLKKTERLLEKLTVKKTERLLEKVTS